MFWFRTQNIAFPTTRICFYCVGWPQSTWSCKVQLSNFPNSLWGNILASTGSGQHIEKRFQKRECFFHLEEARSRRWAVCLSVWTASSFPLRVQSELQANHGKVEGSTFTYTAWRRANAALASAYSERSRARSRGAMQLRGPLKWRWRVACLPAATEKQHDIALRKVALFVTQTSRKLHYSTIYFVV